jgi:hypothetical protein
MFRTFFLLSFIAAGVASAQIRVETVTTHVPFPRGIVVEGDSMTVLSRGRVRSAGGVSGAINDMAGTLWTIDLKTNAVSIFAEPTDPPFRLWNRASDPPESDTRTDRPYCVLRFDPATQNYFICGFSGIDLRQQPGKPSFSKNETDAILRFDRRTRRWHEVYRHEPGTPYAEHEPKGPNNLLVVGRWLFAAGKDNSTLVRYDLSPLLDDPQACPLAAKLIAGEKVMMDDGTAESALGQSALAERDGWLYVGYRTSGVVLRTRVESIESGPRWQVVARFQPWDPATRKTADITDIAFDSVGRLYVLSAEPARVYRFTPAAKAVFDARDDRQPAWADLATLVGEPRLKCENITIDEQDRVWITSGSGYGSPYPGAEGTIYRVLE